MSNLPLPESLIYLSRFYFITGSRKIIHYFLKAASNAGIKVWASQNEKTSLGPVMSNCDKVHQRHLSTKWGWHLGLERESG